MRLLLVNPNRAREPFPVAPLGLAWVAAAARRAGHEVRLLDLNFGDWRRQVAAALAAFRPQAIGLGVRNIDNALRERFRSYVPGLVPIAQALRAVRVPLILGGPGFSLFPKELLPLLSADCGLIGEGEESLPLLLRQLECGRPELGRVPGAVFRRADSVRINPPGPYADLAALPPPAHDLIDYARYETAAGFAAVQTRRGCPERCLYCNYPALEGRPFRLRPPEAVGEELAHLARQGVRHVFFCDAVFNQPAAHAEAVCREVLRRKLKLRWMAYLNPRGLTLRLARLFRRAGCLGAELGIDSASERMLAALSKGFTQAEVVAASQALSGAGIPQSLLYLIGGPGEDRATMREGLWALSRHTRPELVAINVGLRVFPGTRLADLAGDGAGGLEPSFYLSPGMDRAALGELHSLCRGQLRFATPRDLDHPAARALIRLMLALGVRPWWRHAWLYGRLRRLLP